MTRSTAVTTSRQIAFCAADNFFSNYEPSRKRAGLAQDAICFYQFTAPMQALIREFAGPARRRFSFPSAHPRLVDGKPSKNPRYLQKRPDFVNPIESLRRGNRRPPAPPHATRAQPCPRR